MTAPGSRIGALRMTATATAATTKVAAPRCPTCCRIAGAAASNARPAATASISLNYVAAGICLTGKAGLAASLSRHADITGSL